MKVSILFFAGLAILSMFFYSCAGKKKRIAH